jgi:hypothetical protein
MADRAVEPVVFAERRRNREVQLARTQFPRRNSPEAPTSWPIKADRRVRSNGDAFSAVGIDYAGVWSRLRYEMPPPLTVRADGRLAGCRLTIPSGELRARHLGRTMLLALCKKSGSKGEHDESG